MFLKTAFWVDLSHSECQLTLQIRTEFSSWSSCSPFLKAGFCLCIIDMYMTTTPARMFCNIFSHDLIISYVMSGWADRFSRFCQSSSSFSSSSFFPNSSPFILPSITNALPGTSIDVERLLPALKGWKKTRTRNRWSKVYFCEEREKIVLEGNVKSRSIHIQTQTMNALQCPADDDKNHCWWWRWWCGLWVSHCAVIWGWFFLW